MGERFQTHIILNKQDGFGYGDDGKKQIKISIHMQWCWGFHIIRNMYRVIRSLEKSCFNYNSEDEIKEYIKALFIVNKSFNGNMYHYRVHTEEPYRTTNGDSNHGWAVINVDINKNGNTKVISKFYDTNEHSQSNNLLLKRAATYAKYELLDKNYTKEYNKVMKCCNRMVKRFNNTTQNLQSKFNRGLK